LTIFKEKFSIIKPIILGIVGGGQLGKMLAMEAKRMSMTVIVLDPLPDCPASSIADKVMIGNFSDEQKIYDLSKEVDIITYEIELANTTALNNLVKNGFPVQPSPTTLYIIQNKYRQKKFLKENGISVPKFDLITSENHLRNICLEYGLPIMLKACEDSYDGRGNFLIKNEDQITSAFLHFKGKQCMVEEYINFKQEISIMIARNPSGEVSAFPICENIHQENILDLTIAPARIAKKVETEANTLAIKTIESLKGSGIFGIEMFVDQNDNVLVNEIAPRPHNSGHYTIEACSISQFEQHIRAILDYPLPKPFLISNALMINILGPDKVKGEYEISGIDKLFSLDGIQIHIYGKKVTKHNRKLGHITALLRNSEPIETSKKIKRLIEIKEV
jgi:5-(carboxyamino)imidazole ribonucleotide synthase